MDESPDKVIYKILLSPDVPDDGLKRVEIREKCEEKFAKKTFDRHLACLVKQGDIIKIKDLNKGKNSTTRYKIAIDPNTVEQYQKIVLSTSVFNKLLKIKKLSNAKILAGCSYIIELYSVLYQHTIRVLLFQSRGVLIYDILLDTLKEQLYEFRKLFFKRFKGKRNKDRFFDELRILAFENYLHTVTKLRRTMIHTIKPRTIEEALLDHRQPLLQKMPWAEFSKNRSHLEYSRTEGAEKETKDFFKQVSEIIDKNQSDSAEAIGHMRILLQANWSEGSDGLNEGKKIIAQIKESGDTIDDFLNEKVDSQADIFIRLLNLGLPDEFIVGKK